MPRVLFENKNVRWVWKESELERFRSMWEAGKSFREIAIALRRTQLDITLLIIDQAEAGEIRPRPNGIFGEETA